MTSVLLTKHGSMKVKIVKDLAEVKAILKQAGYIIINTDRPRRGGEVGIIYRQNHHIKQLDGLVLDAVEMGLWK